MGPEIYTEVYDQSYNYIRVESYELTDGKRGLTFTAYSELDSQVTEVDLMFTSQDELEKLASAIDMGIEYIIGGQVNQSFNNPGVGDREPDVVPNNER